MTTRRLFHLVLVLMIACGLNPRSSATQTYDFVVAKDGSGNFKTIQEAVTACRDYAERQYFILVKNGVYNEKLVITSWKTHITIFGQDVDSTIIIFNDYSGKTDSWGKKFNTFTSYTCMVGGNNIVFENITFIKIGRAHV
jgi:pectinesterase